LDPLHSDTIVASITGAGPAAVAVLRLSGPLSFEIASSIFAPWPKPVRPRYALVGSYAFGEKGIALPFAEAASFTGQEVVELSIHGGTASIRELLNACIAAGARQALPGEFTLRAFLNGTIDLSQAEAIADIVEAQTARQLRLANLNLEGALRRQVEAILESLTEQLARIEATIDFSEEIGDYDFALAEQEFDRLTSRLKQLNDQGRLAHLSRQGLRVAIVGRPNAGKSSLLNAILGVDRAIVTEIPGTTRDTIEESVDWDGLKVVLVDTAGIRAPGEQIEQLGISRTLSAASAADEIFYVFDSRAGWTDEDEIAMELIGRPVTVIGNKADLCEPERGVSVSALNGHGLETLRSALTQKYADGGEYPPINERQSAHLRLALEALEGVARAVTMHQPIDLVGVLVREAMDHLGRVVGQTASDDMLTEIFSRFCIGK
jgi:tRNA modification GTPase